MKRDALIVLAVLVALLAVVWLTGLVSAASGAPASGAPEAVSYQGQITVDGSPYTGAGYFKFAIVNQAGDTTYWSNDGSSLGGAEPDKPVSLVVSSGLFNVLLGDTSLENMTELPASAFAGTDRRLRVWFSSDGVTFVLLNPDRRIAAAPYALQAEEAANADTLDGCDAGNASGAIPLSNGTVNSNLNADLLDGYHAGNASGAIPLSNGTLNSNLNADLLDGHHAAALSYWSLTGNASTTPGANYLGTSTNQALEIKVNAARALRLEPNATSPNLVGGYSGNWLASGVSGATIGGGGTVSYLNRVTDDYGMVGGGANNQAGDNAGTAADNPYGTVGGGSSNTATASHATVSGGYSNDATLLYATIGGGAANTASGQSATVGGGQTNTASGEAATVAGGRDNTAGAAYAAIGGGYGNDASPSSYATVAGGTDNTASGERATIGGGSSNTATALHAAVGGGYSNDATFLYATVGGGAANTAGGQSATVGGGQSNTASGDYAAVPGGASNAAAGAYSFAAGYRAKANNAGCFVWADATAADYVCSTDNQFAVRATGGISFTTGSAAVLVNGDTIWHAGNDGAGSTLDADLLDGQHASDFQARVSGVCAAGSMISAINPDGTVVCGGLPVEHADRVGSVVTTSPAFSFPLVGFSLEATATGTSTTYHFTFVHELDDSSPIFFESMARERWLRSFTLFVEQPGTALHYLRLDADPVGTASVATATERRPGASPLETITLEFGSPDDPVWTTTGGPIPDPEDFPLQQRVGTLTLGPSITVATFGHEWSASATIGNPSFSPLIVTALLDGSSPQIQFWLTRGTHLHTVQLDLFTPGTTDVMATYQLDDVIILGAEQSASGIPGELAFNKVTLDYERIRETVGTVTFCWDRNTNGPC